MPGDLSWRLGAHFEPKARIFVILEPFPGERGVPFWLLFSYFLDANFSVFFEGLFFCDFGCQKHSKWEAFGGNFGGPAIS